jgi:uncharacterized SAM-binding protein YcdF (DUF218 family)
MDIILELGGNAARLYKVIELAEEHTSAEVIVSSEGSPDHVVGLLRGAGINDDRFLLDFNAWDTVTNFTETVKLIKSFKPKNLYVVTDQFHMKRSMAIARAVYFLSGIRIIPSPYMGSEPHAPENPKYVRDDRFRAWLWRLTGYLKYYPDVKERRMPGIRADQKKAEERGYPVTKMRTV